MPSARQHALLPMLCLAAITITATALAQVGSPGPLTPVTIAQTNDPFGLTPVDQGTSDLGALNTSNRLIPVDLRQPLDFGRLYEAPDDSGRLMRVSGALSAVFPRSEYEASAGFVFPVIPAGTEFFIGPMPVTSPAYTPPAEPSGASLLLDNRISLGIDLHPGSSEAGPTSGRMSGRIDGMNPAPIKRIHAMAQHGITLRELLTGQWDDDDRATPQAPTIWSDEGYRKGRLAILLQRALDSDLGS